LLVLCLEPLTVQHVVYSLYRLRYPPVGASLPFGSAACHVPIFHPEDDINECEALVELKLTGDDRSTFSIKRVSA